VHRCAKSYRLSNWYNCPSKPFVTSHAHACFSLRKPRKSRTMLTTLTFTATSTSATYCALPTRDDDVHVLVVRPITAASRVCFHSCVTRSLDGSMFNLCWPRHGAGMFGLWFFRLRIQPCLTNFQSESAPTPLLTWHKQSDSWVPINIKQANTAQYQIFEHEHHHI